MDRTMRTSLLVLLIVAWSAHAGGPSVSGGGFPSTGLILVNGNCPSGWVADNSAQGRYITGLAATGSAGDTLGSAIPTTTTDSSYTPVGTNSGIAASLSATVDRTALGSATASATHTHPAPTFTGTQNTTMRSTIAPSVALRLCKKA